ncbi:MAG TPA: HAD-IA family hydrolase [Solirubrobacteraceae bacterium]|nr:HAD-IA family hydrolase [Solirubrobacteraceae bacterium]
MTTPVLLVDYGGVISLPQPPGSVDAMAALVDLPKQTFSERYWMHRPAHDRGVEARAYWSAVAGRELTDERVVEQLVRIDVASWSHLNTATMEVLGGLHARGIAMSILSNAPREMAAVLRADPRFGIFDHLIFSSDIGVVKPSRGAFSAALGLLHRAPDEVVFIDDRPDNVAAAAAAGLEGLLFTSADQLSAELAARVAPLRR